MRGLIANQPPIQSMVFVWLTGFTALRESRAKGFNEHSQRDGGHERRKDLLKPGCRETRCECTPEQHSGDRPDDERPALRPRVHAMPPGVGDGARGDERNDEQRRRHDAVHRDVCEAAQRGNDHKSAADAQQSRRKARHRADNTERASHSPRPVQTPRRRIHTARRQRRTGHCRPVAGSLRPTASRRPIHTRCNDEHRDGKQPDEPSLRQPMRHPATQRRHANANSRHQDRSPVSHNPGTQALRATDRSTRAHSEQRHGSRLWHTPPQPEDQCGNGENTAAGPGKTQHETDSRTQDGGSRRGTRKVGKHGRDPAKGDLAHGPNHYWSYAYDDELYRNGQFRKSPGGGLP